MKTFENYKQNIANLGIDDDLKIGLNYYAGCLGAVSSWMNNDNKITNSLAFEKDLPESIKNIESDDNSLASRILIELFCCAYSIDDTIQAPSNDENDFFQFIDESEYNDVDINSYLSFPSSDKELHKFQRCSKLFNVIGYELSSHEISTDEEAFQLGIYHFEYWFNRSFDTNFKSFYISVLQCNILPTVFADVINSIPQPGLMQSQSDLWTFSKELDHRIKNANYDLDLETMQWIWVFHNYIFYEQGQGPNILRDKYKNEKGFELMLSDIFKSIDDFGKNFRLTSKRYKFKNDFNNDHFWQKYCAETNKKVNEDFGISNETLDFNNLGELYSFYSYRFINAMMLFLHKKKKFLFF